MKLRKENGEINDFSFNEQLKALGKLPPGMDDSTDTYVDVVISELYSARKTDPHAQLFIEQQLDMSEWIPECFGISDAVIVSEHGIVVIDYKHGKGVPVEAEGNYQLRIYALGAYAAFRDLYEFKHVKTIIVQPRLDSVTEEILPTEELLRWANDVIRSAAELAWKGEGEFLSGEHCRFCSVKAICRENVLQSLSVIQNMFDSPDVISEDRIEQMLPFLNTAAEWIDDVKEYAYSQALMGKRWRGYKLVRGRRPGRVWSDESEVVDQLSRAGYTKEQIYSTPKLKSVAELEKVLHKSAFEALVGRYVFQGEGKLTLVPEDDKREEYSPVELAFGDLVGDSVNENDCNE